MFLLFVWLQRLKLMLTTSEKLNYKPSAIIDSEDLKNKQEHFKFDFNTLFSSTSRPANYMLSLFSNTPLSEEIKISNVENMQINKKNIHSMGMYYLNNLSNYHIIL